VTIAALSESMEDVARGLVLYGSISAIARSFSMVIQLQRSWTSTRAKAFTLVLCLTSAVLSLHTPAAWAQADQGAITGVVRDASGGVIPNAAVALKSLDTGLVLDTKTNGEGIYVFAPVKIGNYELTANAPGFAPTVQQNLALNIQQRLTANLILKPAGAKETVEVNSEAQLLQTEDASVGQVLTAKMIDETPLAGRNWVFVAQLTAGVVPSNGSKGQVKGDFSANGQREEQNNFILDGVDNNTNFPDFLNGQSYIVRPPPDALAQFKVQTTNYTAEFGHSAGAIVNASLKTGTNSVHGSLWEYFRNDALNTRIALPYTPIVPKYNENQFGFTLGGPLVKDKLFFFVDSEANRIVQGTPTNVTVPTLLMRQGDFSELLNPALNTTGSKVYLYQPGSAGGPNPGNYTANPALNPYVVSCNGQINVYCASQLSQAALNVLNQFPLPISSSTQSNSTTNVKLTDNTAQWDARADWNISRKDQAFVRYSYLNEHLRQPSPIGPILNGSGNLTANLGENFAFSETHIFTSKTVNEFRIGYNYGHLSRVPFANGPNVATDLGLGGIPVQGQLPSLVVGGLAAFGTPAFYPGFEYENVYQILDNVTHVVGNHSLKFGFSFQRIRVSETKPTAPFGSYNFSGTYSSAPAFPTIIGISSGGYGVADFVTNQMASASLTPFFNTDNVLSYRAAYAQDDWKLTPNLTLNIGVRYEVPQPYIERNDNQANFYPTGPLGIGTGSGTFVLPASKKGIALPPVFLTYLAQDNISLTYSDNRSLTNSQYVNFSPRIGLAYSPTDKFVVRGGYGLFYGGLESIGPGVNLGQNVPFNFTSNFPNNGCSFGACKTNGITLETGFTAQIAAGLLNSVSTPLLTGNQPQQQIPYSQQYNLAVQYAVARDTTATIGYVGSVSRHLQVEYDPNRSRALMAPGTNNINSNRPFPQFASTNFTEEAGTSSYNSLQASLERHYSKGLTFLAAYTYAHSLDNAQADLSETSDVGYRAPGIIPLSDETSNSGFDVRHRFAFNGNYELPFGVGRHHLNHSGILDLAAGGWSSTLTFRAQTGEPFSITPVGVTTALGLANAFPVAARNPFSPGGPPDPSNILPSCPTVTRTIAHWFNPCAFSNPLAGTKIASGAKVTDAATAALFAGGRRLSVEGPGYERIDMSLFKRFHTREKQYLQFRADVFNLLNTPAYNIPGQNNDGLSGGQILSVKQPMAYSPDSRFFQFSLKYVF
jgi:outer membrane receptor protein involved in Fe transport